VRPLRFLTYLAPSIPRAFFEQTVDAVAARLGIDATLDCETEVSGPSPDTDPFVSGRADFAFVCAPSYPLLARTAGATLVGAAPVPADPRAEGRPVYFADVVVRAGAPCRGFPDLAGARWTYNDPASLSGWYSMRHRLSEIGHAGPPDSFFSEVRVSGSHRASVRLVASGAADASAIDSNALAIQLRDEPDLALRLRVLETWGPLPIQPLVAARSLEKTLPEDVAAALLDLHRDPGMAARLAAFGFARFGRVDRRFYASFPLLAMPDASSGD